MFLAVIPFGKILHQPFTIVGKVENSRDFFTAGGQTNEFLKFDLVCLQCLRIVVILVSDRVDHYHMPNSVVL